MATVLVVALVLLIVVPAVELAVLFAVGNWIGTGWTFLLLLLSAFVGVMVLRKSGGKAWRAFREASRSGRPPAVEAAEGVLVLVAALLLLLPGFVTDVVGLALLVPPVRRAGGRAMVRRFTRRLPADVANELIGPLRVRSRRGRRATAATPPPATPPPATPPPATPPPATPPPAPEPGAGATTATPPRVIEGEIQGP